MNFKNIVDIDDSGEIDAMDFVILAGIGLAGYFVFGQIFKMMKKG